MKTTIMELKDLGESIREGRVSKGLRLVDLAALAGVSLEAIQKMETGHDFRMSSWLKVMRVLNQESVNVLLNGKQPDSSLPPIEFANLLAHSKVQRVRSPSIQSRCH